MSVSVVPSGDVIRRTARSLRIPAVVDGLTPAFLAQALRRAVHILAPCPRHELERAVYESMVRIVPDPADLRSLVESTLETLLVYGEILEMRPSTDDAWREGPLVLRPAPPSFVARADGAVVIIGVAGDEITPLVGSMNERLELQEVLRTIKPGEDEDLVQVLREIGLLELSHSHWLRLPPVETASAYLLKWEQDLDAAPTSAVLEGLRVIGPRQESSFYPDRWIDPARSLSGTFVGRRPQKYGAPLWCLVRLHQGSSTHFIDLISRGDRLRPCDIAWRIQMAMDADAGAPQMFRVRSTPTQCFLDFLSPLPSWAERRLAVAGQRTTRNNSLLTYLLPPSALDEEARFLGDRLWLRPEQI